MKKKNTKRNVYIITPCSRKDNLPRIRKSIDFKIIKKWIIVYDNNSINQKKKIYSKDKDILEFFVKDIDSVSGNSQRNYGLDYLNKLKNKNFYIYFLDDDNIIHKNFYKIIKQINLNEKFIYTFDQFRNQKVHLYNKFKFIKILKGNTIKQGYIDIAMFLANFSLINNIRWSKKIYIADGKYVEDCLKNKKKYHRYLPITACYYNFIQTNFFAKFSFFNFLNKLKNIL